MVLEYMNAGSLQDLLTARTPIGERLTAAVCDAVARGLEELHRRKQIHRDIKPSNILLDCGGASCGARAAAPLAVGLLLLLGHARPPVGGGVVLWLLV